MAKRHYGMSKERMERMGGHAHHPAGRPSYGPSYYEGPEERAMQEREDGGMIRNDYHAVANMPQEVMYKPWPACRYEDQPPLNDRISGIDHQVADDESEHKAGKYPEKY